MDKFEKALKLASIRLANIYLENTIAGEPPSPGKVFQELIKDSSKYKDEDLSSYWKNTNSFYKKAE